MITMTTVAENGLSTISNEAELLAAFRGMEEALGRDPEKGAAIQVPWAAPLVEQFIELAVREKLWLVADHLMTALRARGPVSRELARLATRIRNFTATMFVQVPQIDPAGIMGKAIARYVAELQPRTILDVGAATGLGTTRTFSEAAIAAGLTNCVVHSMESEKTTFGLLRRNTAGMTNVRPVLSALITDLDVPEWDEIRRGIEAEGGLFKQFKVDEVEQWYLHGVALLRQLRTEGLTPYAGLPAEIDIAMIDADLFFAKEELAAILNRTKLVMMDDVKTFKNAYNHQMLSGMKEWEMIAYEPDDRHGWSAFRRR